MCECVFSIIQFHICWQHTLGDFTFWIINLLDLRLSLKFRLSVKTNPKNKIDYFSFGLRESLSPNLAKCSVQTLDSVC